MSLGKTRQLLFLVSKRNLSNTRVLLQQQFSAARNAPVYRSFGQAQGGGQSQAAEPVDQFSASTTANGEDYIESDGGMSSNMAPTKNYNRTYATPSRFNNAPNANATPISVEASKPGVNPFPEEVIQDYSNPSLFVGASNEAFSKETSEILQAGLDPSDIEIKPDGACYLPESRYRRILCRAFGVGGWCLVPRGAHSLNGNVLSREYALFVAGRYISQARGHGSIQGFSSPAMTSEVVRSNALMRVCKDIGIGNELWDPLFCFNWKASYAIKRIDNGKVKWSKNEQL